MRIKLERVHFMPKELHAGMLYVSEEFGAAAHLCACGCGAKIRTPLGPTDWSVEETSAGPTLRPSVGNWQQACQSHYWISRGEVNWATQWTPEQILEGRRDEDERRQSYYESLGRPHAAKFGTPWEWFKKLFKRK